jgi:hypothetical protein
VQFECYGANESCSANCWAYSGSETGWVTNCSNCAAQVGTWN